MSNTDENPYREPESNLMQKTNGDLVAKFKRQSAWAVCGLALITLGIYHYFWLYSQIKVVNSVHENPISLSLVHGFLFLVLLSYIAEFFGESLPAVIALLVVTVLFILFYVLVVFKFRNRLQDILTRSSGRPYKLNGILAFFLCSVYFQYKINECFE